MVWLELDINNLSPALYSMYFDAMTPERKQEVLLHASLQARQLSVAGEMLAKQAASQLTALPTDSLVLTKDTLGKPLIHSLSASDSPEVFISVSHSGSRAVAAASLSPIGIDIEIRKPVHPQIHKRICTPQEADELENTSDRDLYLLKLWTAKEAFFKREGTGITNFKSVETSILDKQYFISPQYIICIVQ